MIIYVKHYACSLLTKNINESKTLTDHNQHDDNQITIVNVVCGDEYLSYFFTLVKSAIIFQNSAKLHFITLTEPNMQNKLEEQVIMSTGLFNMIRLGKPHN